LLPFQKRENTVKNLLDVSSAHGLGQQIPLEQHFRVNQLAERLGVSRRSVIRKVDQYSGKVARLGRGRSRFGRITRPYVVRLVPETVVRQIYKDLLREAQ
jgi:hypothetical protein